jgi:hypothetical protein
MPSQKELKEIAKLLASQGDEQQKINNSASEYLKLLEKIGATKKQENFLSNQNKELEKEKIKLQNSNNQADKDRVIVIKSLIKLNNTTITQLQETNKQNILLAKNVNKVTLAINASSKAMAGAGNLAKKGYATLKGYGVFQMDKEIRMSALAMGKMASAGSDYGKTLAKSAEKTTFMGITLQDLAKMQANFSTEMGRTVMLSEDGLVAMAAMAEGTMLGAEGAASLAANMDGFNISSTKTRDILEETTNVTERMGINSTKVLKSLQNNLKLANKYHFKGGVKGMSKMATQAVKFGTTMETTAQFADKLFNIEGAVEMAAKLNTMGGEWSKLGDPMKLMYQARNDMAGLQTSVIDATAGMASFNKTTGEFSFSGLELHRMRELEKITGISADKMAEMAKAKAKFAKIRGQLGFSIDDDMQEFIENTAQFKDGEYKIKLDGQEDLIPIRNLTIKQKELMISMDKTLKQRAENSQTFDDQLTNLSNTFKSFALPIIEGLNDSIPSIKGLFNEIKEGGWFENLKEFGRNIGEVIGGAIKLITEFPKTFAGGIAAVMGGSLLLKAASWYTNGKILAAGFNSVAGSGSNSMMDGMYGKNRGIKAGAGRIATAAKGGGLKGAGKAASRIIKGSMKGNVVGSLLMGGVDVATNLAEGKDATESIGRALVTTASSFIGGALGSLVAPGGGTIVGGIGGGMVGDKIGNAIWGDKKDIKMGKKANDAVVANGIVTPIDTKDKVYQVSKPGGAFDKANNSNSRNNTNNNNTHKVKISFDEIIVRSDSNVGKIDLENDTAFMQMLASKIKQTLTETGNGGVLTPNPI